MLHLFKAKKNNSNKWIYFDLVYLWNCSKQWLDIDWDTVEEASIEEKYEYNN